MLFTRIVVKYGFRDKKLCRKWGVVLSARLAKTSKVIMECKRKYGQKRSEFGKKNKSCLYLREFKNKFMGQHLKFITLLN